VELAPGTILLGKYRIDDLIGTGGMGNVVRASHLYLHQPFAIKILLPQMAESDSTKQRFLREAQATVRLKSEHSARVWDVGTMPDGAPFMVMEFLDGNDLNQILRHHGPQAPAIVVDLMLQACEGISEAHALGIVHRDIKPSNFFVTQRPDGSMLLKILDFGISKTPVGYEDLTGTQTVLGTPSYMAPEQMKSGRSADPRSDIWSIGVVMYQLLTGRPPFSGESYAELVLKVGLEAPAPIPIPLPTGLGDLIMRCLEKDPAQRFQNAGELARMLAPYATDPISAAQSAGRSVRILQQRGMQLGMQGSPLSAGGGLATPISPAQLTPRSWPSSQATSLSQGAGQVTVRTRSGRGWLIAGVASLCVVAGVGGYAISQMSRSDTTRSGTHVEAPEGPQQPPPEPPAAPAATAPTPAATAPTPAATAPTPAATAPTPAATAPTPAAPEPPAPGSDVPTTWKPTSPTPTIVEHPAAVPTPPTSTAANPAVTKPAPELKPEPKTEPKAVTKPASEPKTVTKPAVIKPAVTKPAVTKPAVTKPAVTKPVPELKPEPKTEPKPVTKPTKPKKSDDLFDTRH
jgi:eukaryotic-like serine/threonine-protein kinase